jgi:hypothetical protein
MNTLSLAANLASLPRSATRLATISASSIGKYGVLTSAFQNVMSEEKPPISDK